MSLITDNFSNIPERCLGCPALFDMALDIDIAISTSATAALQSLETDNPTIRSASERVSFYLTRIGLSRIAAYEPLVEKLVEKCQSGVIESKGRTKFLRKKVGSTICGSSYQLPDEIMSAWKNT